MAYLGSEAYQRRKEDEQRAGAVQFLADKLYSQNGLSVTRTEDTELQKKGIDFIAKTKRGEILLIDEKCAVKYWDKDLDTFAFEIAAHNNVKNQGWLYHGDSLTTHYMLIWVRARTAKLDDIYFMDMMLIRKADIIELIHQKMGLEKADMLQLLKDSGKGNEHRVHYRLNKDMKLVQSLHLKPEQPVNLLLSKGFLNNMAVQKILYERKV